MESRTDVAAVVGTGAFDDNIPGWKRKKRARLAGCTQDEFERF